MTTGAAQTAVLNNRSSATTTVGRRFAVVFPLALIILCGVILRGYRLDARSVWFDEAFCCRLIEFPFSDLLDRTAQDNHPPLYFFLLKTWAICFGNSAFALRSLSVLLGIGTVIGMYLFTCEAYADESTRLRERALMVAALVALSVFQIRWSWEIRMYSLGTCLAAFSSWAMFRALHAQNDGVREWSIYGILALLFLYTHYYAFFGVAAQALFIIGFMLIKERGILSLLRSSQLKQAMISALIVVVGYAPWLPYFLLQRNQVQRQFWIPPVTGWKAANTLYEMFFEPENASIDPTYSALVAVVCAGVLMLLLWRCRAGDVYLVIATLLPFALSLLISAFDTSIFHIRYFVFAQLFLLAGLGVLVTRLPFGWLRAGIAAALLGTMLYIDVAFWTNLDVVHKPGARAAAAFVSDAREPNEPVVVTSSMLYLAMLHHLDSREGWRAFHDGGGLAHHEGRAVIAPEELVGQDDLYSFAGRSAWVVSGFAARPIAIPSNWTLIDQREFAEVYRFQGTIQVRRFVVNGRPPR